MVCSPRRPGPLTAKTRNRLVASCALAVLAAACGSSGPATSTSPHPTPSSAGTSSPDTIGAANAFGLDARAIQSALTGYVAPGATFSQKSSGTWQGVVGTHQTFFASSDGAARVEVDVIPDTTPVTATTDYVTALAYTKSGLTIKSSSTPAIGSQSNEYIGQATGGTGPIGVDALSFRDGATVAMVFWEIGSGIPAAGPSLAVARAEDLLIASAKFAPGPCGSQTCLARFEGTVSPSGPLQFTLGTPLTTSPTGWYSILHYTYPVTKGASCQLTSWSVSGPTGYVDDPGDPTTLGIAQSNSSETEQLAAGIFTIELTAKSCFWRILVTAATGP